MSIEDRDKKTQEASKNVRLRLSLSRKYPIIFIIIGAIGLALTGIFMIRLYNNTSNVKGLMLPLILYFIPFTVSFLLLRFGIQRLSNRTR